MKQSEERLEDQMDQKSLPTEPPLDTETQRRLLTRIAWNRAADAYATGVVFERRSRRLRAQIRLLAFGGLLGPVFIGGVVLSFRAGGSAEGAIPAWLIAATSALVVVELVLALWALAADWVDHLSYAAESTAENYQSYEDWKDLAQFPPEDLVEHKQEYELLRGKDLDRLQQDYKWGVKDWEKRRGMREYLREHQKACAKCEEVPASKRSKPCEVCGRFGLLSRLRDQLPSLGS